MAWGGDIQIRAPRALAAAVLLGAALAMSTSQAGASKAPVRLAPAAGNETDAAGLYAFVGPDRPSRVTLIATWTPSQPSAAASGFSTSAFYDINVDNTGDGKADLVYRWDFEDRLPDEVALAPASGVITGLDDADLGLLQTYDLTLLRRGHEKRALVRDGIVVPGDVGEELMPDYDSLRAEAIERFGAGKAFAGPADDPSFADLALVDLLPAGVVADGSGDSLAGFNVNTIALQLPKSALARQRDSARHPVIGVWSSAARHKTTVLRSDGTMEGRGRLVQVSRFGMPLVHELVIPATERPRWEVTQPSRDRRFRELYSDPLLPRALGATLDRPTPDSDPAAPGVQRTDLLQVFLTGVPGLNQPTGRVVPGDALRLNMSIPPCASADCDTYSALGVIGGDFAGFPNGRRLSDDVVDATLQILEGELLDNPNTLSDDVDEGDVALEEVFPYVGLPHPPGGQRSE